MKMFRKLLEHNITNCTGQFFCHLCMSSQPNITDVLNHINEKEHQMLKCDHIITISRGSIKVGYQAVTEDKVAMVALDMFLCIPCRNVSANLDYMLQHIQSEEHITNIKSECVNFCYNGIKDGVQIADIKSKLEKKVKKIDLCNAECALLEDKYTIKWHDKCLPLKVIRILYDYSNSDCKTLVKNGIVVVDCYRLICLLCYQCYETPADIHQHISNKKHQFQMNKIDMELSSNKNNKIQDIRVSSETIIKAIELNEPKIQYKGQDKSIQLLLPISTGTEEERATDNSENHKNNTSLSSIKKSYEILDSNKIVTLDSGALKCNICSCSMPSYNHALQHIKGKQHTAAVKRKSKEKQNNNKNIDFKIVNEKGELCVLEAECINKKIAITLPKGTTEKIYDLNLDANEYKTISKDISQRLQKNGIIRKSNTFMCPFCKQNFPSLHDTLQHINGKSHKSVKQTTKVKVQIDNIVCNMRLLKKNVHLVENLVDNINDENNEVENKNKNDIILQDCSYYCELCNIKIDIDHLFEHINTTTHKCNIFSINMGDDLVLYKCFCCKVVMQGNSSLVIHLSLQKHLSNLATTLKDTKTTKCKEFPLCNVFIQRVEDMSTQFIEKRLIFFDTAHVKLCDNLKNHIPYRCSFCDVKLDTDHNLIEHCKARMHTWKIKQLFRGEEHSVANDGIMLITEQLDNISVTDKKSPKLLTLGIDSVISSDVQADITKHVKASPFLSHPSTNIKPKKETFKIIKPKERTLAERLNKVYYEKHLEIEEEMYTLDKQKLSSIESNLKLFMPQNEKNLYCFSCDTSVSKELYLLYEHVCLKSHMKNNKIERDTETKKLLSQYIRGISKCMVKCYPCGNFIFNDPLIIKRHIDMKSHKRNYTKFSTFIDNTFKCIMQDLNSLWYNIQRFACILCNAGFKYKLEFIEHIIAKHHVKNYVFDFCIPCATLWLGKMDSYTEHCNDIMHKYLMKSKDFFIEDLPQCIKELLTQVDKTVDILIQQTQVLLSDNIHQEMIKSLENSIKPCFPSVKAFLFGSRLTGLGCASSDIDIYLDCGGTYYENKTVCIKSDLLIIEKALRKQKDEWIVEQILEETRTPIIKLIYKRTGVHCDISVTNGLSVENSRLIRSFIDAYLPCKQLILFVKKWFSLFNLPGRHGVTSYALVWLVIFYLQSELHLPSVATLIKEQNSSRRVCGWETGVAQPQINNKSVQSVSTLLLGFFKFYANFDYQHCIVCPLMGYSLTKKAFTKLHTLPKEMKPYVEYLTTSVKPEYFHIDSPFCVQDPFDLSHNLTKAANNITLKYFKHYCQQSVSVLPSTTV